METIQQNSPAEHYAQFQQLLSTEHLESVAAQLGALETRKRSLPTVRFFWLMVLSHTKATTRGTLSALVAFFTTALATLWPDQSTPRLSRMAISKKTGTVSWQFFRHIFQDLVARYVPILPSGEQALLKRFQEVWAVDTTTIRLNKLLERVFQSLRKGQASLKLHVRFSVKNLCLSKLRLTNGRRREQCFRFVTKAPNTLYLFDLGYWCFALFQAICDAQSYFVSRLKSGCNPLILHITDQRYADWVGKRLSEVLPLLPTSTVLDVTVRLSNARTSALTAPVRLFGQYLEQQWYFYITNIFEQSWTVEQIYQLYRQRWMIEIFFNDIKHVLKLEHILSKTTNGIRLEIYACLILYTLTRIVIALAAQQTGEAVTRFSFKRSAELVATYLRQMPALLGNAADIKWQDHILCLTRLVRVNGHKDKPKREKSP